MQKQQETPHPVSRSIGQHRGPRLLAIGQPGIEQPRLIGLFRQRQSQIEKTRDLLRRAIAAHIERAAISLRELARLAPQRAARLARKAGEVIVETAVHRDVVAAEILACAHDMTGKARRDCVCHGHRRGQDTYSVGSPVCVVRRAPYQRVFE